MEVSNSPQGRFQEYAFVTAGVLGNFCQSATFYWISPLLYYFKQPGANIFLTPEETTWLSLMCDLSSTIFSPFVCYATDVFGRKAVLWSASPISAITWLLVLFNDQSKIVLFAMRIIQGITVITANAVLPIYLSEIASVKVRGGVVSSMNSFWILGMVYIAILSIFFDFRGITWLTLAPSLIHSILFYFCPESPYYLLMKNRKDDAVRNLVRIRGGTCMDDNIIDEIAIMEETIEKDKQDRKSGISRKYIKAFLMIEGITVCHMMVGCNTIPFNSSDSIAVISGNIDFAKYISMILSLVLFIMTVLSMSMSDCWGRRPILMLSSAAAFFLFLAAAALLYFIQVWKITSGAWTTLAYAFILAGACFNTFGIESQHEVLVGELFPTNAKSITTGITFSVFTFSSGMSLYLYSYLERNVGIYANYIVFAGFSALGYIVYKFALPETKKKTFGEIQNSL